MKDCVFMITPIIIDVDGLPSADRERVLDAVSRIAVTGYEFRRGTNQAVFFCEGSMSLSDVSRFISVDSSRLTDATGWEIISWLRG